MSTAALPVLESAEPARPVAAFRPRAPYHMVWLATNACNARCVHCSSDSLKRLPGELSTDEAKGLADQLAGFGVFDLAVSGGEPLTRPDLFEILGYVTSLGIRVGLGTNGTTINPRVVARLRDLGLDRLQVSIDGLEATHDVARRWQGLYRRSVRAIAAGLDGGLKVHVCFTGHRLNHHELGDVIDRCVEWGVHRFNFSRFVPTGRGDASLDLTPREWARLVAAFDEKRREHEGRMRFSTHLAQLILADPELDCQPGFGGCQAGQGQGCIGPRGEIMPCVMLPVVAGNIRKHRLREIWESSAVLSALRDRSLLGGWCGSCAFRDKCGGCRGVAYAYTRDYLAADPRCWLFAEPDSLPA